MVSAKGLLASAGLTMQEVGVLYHALRRNQGATLVSTREINGSTLTHQILHTCTSSSSRIPLDCVRIQLSSTHHALIGTGALFDACVGRDQFSFFKLPKELHTLETLTVISLSGSYRQPVSYVLGHFSSLKSLVEYLPPALPKNTASAYNELCSEAAPKLQGVLLNRTLPIGDSKLVHTQYLLETLSSQASKHSLSLYHGLLGPLPHSS